MPLLALLLAVAALVPFAGLLLHVAKVLATRLQNPRASGIGLILLSTACVATIAALDTGLVILALSVVRLTLHSPALP